MENQNIQNFVDRIIVFHTLSARFVSAKLCASLCVQRAHHSLIVPRVRFQYTSLSGAVRGKHYTDMSPMKMCCFSKRGGGQRWSVNVLRFLLYADSTRGSTPALCLHDAVSTSWRKMSHSSVLVQKSV